MRLKTKKNIALSAGLIFVLTIICWYCFPVLFYKCLVLPNTVPCEYLNAPVVSIDNLKNPPKNWNKVILGNMSMKLPMHEITKIRSHDKSLGFKINKIKFAILDIVPSKEALTTLEKTTAPYPAVVPYQYLLSILKSTPSDISFFNSRNKNNIYYQNLIVKAVSVPKGGLDKIISIQSKGSKALCLISEKYENSYSATVHVYSQNEKTFVQLLLKCSANNSALELTLLTFLGGLEMPNQPNDRDQVTEDINKLVSNFNKT